MICVNVLYEVRIKISAGSNNKLNFSPYWDTHCKIAHFGKFMSIDMTLPKWGIFTMGVYGEILHHVSDLAEISFKWMSLSKIGLVFTSFKIL